MTNVVQTALSPPCRFAGAQWLESSCSCEESLYWLSLLVDTTVPLVGHVSQRAHGTIGNDGDHNILAGVKYITSKGARDLHPQTA